MTYHTSDLPPLTWSADAMRIYCQQFGFSPAQAEAMIVEENVQLAAAWAGYRRRHPGGTVRAFGLEQIEQAAFEMMITSGVPPSRARALARNARRRAGEHAP